MNERHGKKKEVEKEREKEENMSSQYINNTYGNRKTE